MQRAKRLVRLVSAIEKLKQVEQAAQASANAKLSAVHATAVAIDSVETSGCDTWSLFPQLWLQFRAGLDRDATDFADKAAKSAREIERLKKAEDRLESLQGKMATDEARKQAAEDLMEFITVTATSKPAMGKLEMSNLEPNKR